MGLGLKLLDHTVLDTQYIHCFGSPQKNYEIQKSCEKKLLTCISPSSWPDAASGRRSPGRRSIPPPTCPVKQYAG